jgi:hypothetical protein
VRLPAATFAFMIVDCGRRRAALAGWSARRGGLRHRRWCRSLLQRGADSGGIFEPDVRDDAEWLRGCGAELTACGVSRAGSCDVPCSPLRVFVTGCGDGAVAGRRGSARPAAACRWPRCRFRGTPAQDHSWLKIGLQLGTRQQPAARQRHRLGRHREPQTAEQVPKHGVMRSHDRRDASARKPRH